MFIVRSFYEKKKTTEKTTRYFSKKKKTTRYFSKIW